MQSKKMCLVTAAVLLSVVVVENVASAQQVEFNRDIRPILSDKCFACHGPDKNHRKADLRLDTEAGLRGTADAPGTVIPGKPDESELFLRVTSDDAELKMPPPKQGKELNSREINLIKRWISQGAKWQGHWSLQPIRRPIPPPVADESLASNSIDRFVLHGLKEKQLSPSPEADRITLIRRLSFDITGLPPTMEEVDRFVNDASPQAYENLVDRLLASPHYGERMAQWWLDLVRYADSVGYHGDQAVSVFPFRDYVIQSFNENKPFDRFTLEQLAGDLLLKDEVKGMKDDVKNSAESAFVSDSVALNLLIASGYNRLGMMSAEGGVQPKEYLAKYIAERVRNLGGTWLGMTTGCCECHDHKFDPLTIRDFYSLEAFFADIQERGLYAGANASGDWGPRVKVPSAEQSQRWQELQKELPAAKAQWETALTPFTSLVAPPHITALIAKRAGVKNVDDLGKIVAHYKHIAPQLEKAHARWKQLEKARADLEKAIPTTLVTAAVEPRTVRVLARGNWLDESGTEVRPAVPEFLPQAARGGDRRFNRADLARWLTAPENPLTARVFVNRVWKLFFGAGLSRRVDDLGAQGEWPSHPELLDWLAGEFVRDWDVKRLVKLIVMSRTYRQSSHESPRLREVDPENRLLARQSRFRLDAEFVRDNVLRVSGLLVERIGGESVNPYQPPGYWAHLNFPTREWKNGEGDDLYRRGLYTHWQRQYLHPSLMAFDAPSREECVAERTRSNTPLQSLVLLNDPSYVEAARALAEQVLRQGGATTDERLKWMYHRVLSRAPQTRESTVLAQLLASHQKFYREETQSAQALLSAGKRTVPADLSPDELAAWTSVSRAILSLHETTTRY